MIMMFRPSVRALIKYKEYKGGQVRRQISEWEDSKAWVWMTTGTL
jgi:hypothetical protein